MRIATSIDSDAEQMEPRMNRVFRSAKRAQINGKDYLLKIYLEYFLYIYLLLSFNQLYL